MKNNQPVLVILTPGFPENESDTSCLPSQQIFIRSLNKNFPYLKIIILSFQYPFSTSIYNWYDNTVIPFNGMKTGIIAKIQLWRYLWRILNKLKEENNIIGLLSFWCGECALIGKYFGKKNKVKHFSWIMGQDAKKGNKYVMLIHPKPNELITISDFLAAEFYKNYGIRPSHIIPYGIDASLFPLLNVERDITILGAGSLIPLKQYDIFINIVKEITEKIPGVSLMLCGKGPQEMQLKKIIAQHKLQNNIILTGEKPHSEILEFMQRTKIFLHTSNYEGFGMVCLEALYAGCHVISFIKPMLQDIDHWHVVQTKEEMIKKTIDLLKNRKTAYTTVKPFTMENSARAMMKLFNHKETTTS